MNKVVGIHAWEPGLQGNMKTSAGGGIWFRCVLDTLANYGHTVVWLGKPPAPKLTQLGKVQDCDIVFFGWRWNMPNYPERQEAYRRQNIAIGLCDKFNIPFVAHDEDYKMTDYAISRVMQLGGVVARPELYPDFGIARLMFPLPYELQPLNHSYNADLVYVGNNYNRYDQAVDFLEKFAKASKRVHVYGNWLEQNPEREAPEKVVADFPHVQFKGRLPQNEIINVVKKSRTTVHLCKKEYGDHGFLAPRWAEAAAAGTPAFVPATFRIPQEDTRGWERFIVNDGAAASSVFFGMRDDTHDEIAEAQRIFVKKYMRAEAWLEMIDDVIYGRYS